MAPEQVSGAAVDHRADLFSLGCVIYEMSTGRRPFAGEDTLTVLANLALTRPPLPHALNRDVPARLSALVMWLLAKKPEGRPSSTAEVLRRLRTLQEEAARPAPPEHPLPVELAEGVMDALPADPPPGRPAEPPWWTQPALSKAPSPTRTGRRRRRRRAVRLWYWVSLVSFGLALGLSALALAYRSGLFGGGP
jgi:serine/threonine protein kinase